MLAEDHIMQVKELVFKFQLKSVFFCCYIQIYNYNTHFT